MVNKKAIELAILWHFSQFNTILLDYKKIDQRRKLQIAKSKKANLSSPFVLQERDLIHYWPNKLRAIVGRWLACASTV